MKKINEFFSHVNDKYRNHIVLAMFLFVCVFMYGMSNDEVVIPQPVASETSEDAIEFSDDSLSQEALAKTEPVVEAKKVHAYLLKIGDDFVVALKDEKDLKEALDYAKSKYLNVDADTADIALVKDERNPLVISPVLKLNKAVEKKVLRTSTGEQVGGTDFVEYPEVQWPEPEAIQEEIIVDAHFATDVIVVEAYVDEDEIEDVKTAKELITKENEKEKKYVVEPGDYPEVIAQKNEMPTEKLYDLNPGLRERDSYIQIGEELTVMVPEPELSVALTEELVYDEPIDFETDYEPNPDKYVGHETVKSEGIPGVKRVTASVEMINGSEVSREIISEETITEPVNQVVLRGSKPLPSRGATGVFISPLESYVVTSPYGYRWGRLHKGIDISAGYGATVMASDGGVVTFAGWSGSYGNTVIIDHGDGCTTRYAHNSELLVSAGQYVSQYEAIALLGSTGNSTGPHVHFEIMFDGVTVDPANYVNF